MVHPLLFLLLAESCRRRRPLPLGPRLCSLSCKELSQKEVPPPPPQCNLAEEEDEEDERGLSILRAAGGGQERKKWEEDKPENEIEREREGGGGRAPSLNPPPPPQLVPACLGVKERERESIHSSLLPAPPHPPPPPSTLPPLLTRKEPLSETSVSTRSTGGRWEAGIERWWIPFPPLTRRHTRQTQVRTTSGEEGGDPCMLMAFRSGSSLTKFSKS